MSYHTVIVLDCLEDRLLTQSLELVTFAGQLSAEDSAGILLIIPGRSILSLGEELSAKFGLDVLALEHPALYYPNPELLRQLLREVVERYNPETVCFQHTMRNCQIASGLAAALSSSSITAVEAVNLEDGGKAFRRSIYNGKLVQTVRPLALPAIITVLPGTSPLPEPGESNSSAGKVIHSPQTTELAEYCPEGLCREPVSGVKLEEADIIIAAGRGIGKLEHLAVIEEIARIFPNSAVGASRPLCDLKWLPFAHQVGVTGKTVSPRLYIACGISGAQQHLAGMKGAQLIVAINRDPNAAIFAHADFIIVEDLIPFLTLFLERYREGINILDH